VVHILMQVCDALSEAHALGLIHRDIKPANVYLCERGGVPDCVKVLDFGLVRLYRNRDGEQNRLTGEQDIVGTPWFMSPESIKNPALSDPRSDIYAVGALAYFLLTREYVFNAESVLDIYEQQITQTPKPLRERNSTPVSPELEQTVLRCLQRDVKLRPQTIGELRSLLDDCPLTETWGPPERAAWWASHPPQAALSAESPSSPIPATIRIEFAPGTNR